MTAADIRQKLTDTRILIVPYCHPDWAWTHTRAWHEARYVHVFERVLEIMRENDSFRWYLDSWVTQFKPFLDRRPDLVPELSQRISEGKIAICGTYANIRPNMVGEETFIRNLSLGRGRFRGMFPDADLSVHADIVDVALGHPQVPQLMKLGGYEFFRAWRPQAGLTEGGVPYEWVWQGLDGSQIVCSRGCYGGMCSPESVPERYAEKWDQTVEHLWNTELELVSRHSPTGVLWVSQGMDDGLPLQSHGGDLYLDVPGLIAEWNRLEKPLMAFATPQEFYRAVMESGKPLSVMEGTLDPCDVCYNAAWAGSHGLWRKRYVADEELVLAELWQTVSASCAASALHDYSAVGREANRAPFDDFTKLWENTLLLSAHALQWLFQEDFDEMNALAEVTILQARQSRNTSLNRLARRIPQPPNTAAIVFNPLPFERTETVQVLLTASTGVPDNMQVLDGQDRPVPHQLITPMEYAGRIWESYAIAQVKVPPLGYTTLRFEETAQAAPVTVDPGVFLDYDGGKLLAIACGGQTFLGAVPWNTLRVHEVDTNGPLHAGAITATHDAQWSEPQVLESGPVRWRHVQTGEANGHSLRLETLCFANEPRIEFRLTCDWRGGDGFLAALWPQMPGTIETDVPFGAEAKDLDSIKFGTIPGHRSDNIERLREGMFYARSFVSAGGVTHVTHDGDRYYIRNREEGSLAHILINSVRAWPEGWEQHVNYQRDADTRHTFTWSLVFHRGDWRQAGMVQQSARLRRPVQVGLPHGTDNNADLPAEHSFGSVNAPNVVLSALYHEGASVQLRLWESQGQETEVRVTLPFRPLSACCVDFQGNADQRLTPDLEGNTLTLKLEPWQIATVRFTF